MAEREVVIQICGEYPPNYKKVDIASNPNYVFVNDPNYNSVQLFDYDKNTVFVNSFIECEHYVEGGWSYLPEVRNESFYHNSLLYASMFIIFSGILTFRKLFQK